MTFVPRYLGRYLLWQLPGWVGAGLLVLWLMALVDLPGWAAALLFALFVAKDLALYPIMRRVLVPANDAVIGARGRAVEPLAPEGYVRVNGELWRARAAVAVARGDDVIVRSAAGLTLVVEPAPPARR